MSEIKMRHQNGSFAFRVLPVIFRTLTRALGLKVLCARVARVSACDFDLTTATKTIQSQHTLQNCHDGCEHTDDMW